MFNSSNKDLRAARSAERKADRDRRAKLRAESLKLAKGDALHNHIKPADYTSNYQSNRNDPFHYGKKKINDLSEEELKELKRNRARDYRKFGIGSPLVTGRSHSTKKATYKIINKKHPRKKGITSTDNKRGSFSRKLRRAE